METNKIYCKLDENKVIQGYFICFAKEPKYRAIGCNFDEKTDHEIAIEVEVPSIDNIHVGYSQVINGTFIENKELVIEGI